MQNIVNLWISFFIGTILGCLVTRKASSGALYAARLRGLRQGRKEQALLISQLRQRITHLEATARRMTFQSVKGGRG